MRIVVCVKQVVDPDLPPAKFHVDENASRVIPPDGMPPVINPYDALAMEAALRIKEKQGARILVVILGDRSCEDVIRRCLAMGGDEGFIISDPSFEGSDGFGIAYILSQVIKKIASYDLILCGRQAADWDMGIVGSVIGEYLDIPIITRAKALEFIDGKIRVERVIQDTNEVFESGFPVLVTVSNELGQPRIPSAWGIIEAARKEIPIWTAEDMELDTEKFGTKGNRNPLQKLYLVSYGRECEFVTGKNTGEVTDKLARRIVETKLI